LEGDYPLYLLWRCTRHNRDEICREIEGIFPHWYERKFVLEGSVGNLDGTGPEIQIRDVPSTVREYLRENIPADREDRELVLSLADELLAEEAVR
jgi:exonuclease SbcD